MLKKWAMAAAILGWGMGSVGTALAWGPQTGIWSVTAEKNGKPGRGFNIDVQDDTLVMQVYAYERNGAPTFYLTSGKLVDNRFVGTLNKYRGGRYLGSGDRSGVEAGSPGGVRVRFTSSTTGYIQLPGEGEKAISRFEFGYSRSDAASIMGTRSFVGAISGTNTVYTEVEDLYTNIGPSSSSGAGLVVSKSRTFACEQQISGELAGLTLCIRMSSSGTLQRGYVIRWSLHDGEGDLVDKSGNVMGAAFARRLIDGRNNGTGLLRSAEVEDAAKLAWDAEAIKRQFLEALAAY